MTGRTLLICSKFHDSGWGYAGYYSEFPGFGLHLSLLSNRTVCSINHYSTLAGPRLKGTLSLKLCKPIYYSLARVLLSTLIWG